MIYKKVAKMLRTMRDDYFDMCSECPFDGGGVSDCDGEDEFGMCVIDKAIELLEGVKNDSRK